MKTLILSLVTKTANPKNWILFIKKTILSIPNLFKWIIHFLTFFLLFIDFFIIAFISTFGRLPIIGIVFKNFHIKWMNIVDPAIAKVVAKIEYERRIEVNRTYLIFLAFENLKGKITRSAITILGMSVGVGIIVYLLSLGYGIERLVISQIATLNELKIVDVSASENTALQINQQIIKRINSIKDVDQIIPLISVVGRISFNKAKTDVLVYAVTEDYLKAANVATIKGKLFTSSNDTKYQTSAFDPIKKVAGTETKLIEAHSKEPIKSNLTSFNILPQETATVWSDCSISSEVIGYTIRIEGDSLGQEIWGGSYAPFDEYGRGGYDKTSEILLGKWIIAKVPLYVEVNDRLIPRFDDNGSHLWEIGCIQQKYIQTLDQNNPLNQVLGTATGSASLESSQNQATLSALLANLGNEATSSATSAYDMQVVSTDSAGIEIIRLQASTSAQIANNKKTIPFSRKSSGEAIISTGLMKLLGLTIRNAIGTEFNTSFIIVKSLMPDIEGRAFSNEVKYKVVGIVDDEESQYVYVPIGDMVNLGVQNVSQLKVTVKNKDHLPSVRTSIETIGFNTSSVIDTVAQIESLFATIRVVLALVGLIALGVASLGMFNTLTVSLLERTREIGGMKTIGMISNEILDLFLAEAMIMGFAGGFGGLFLGFLAGQASSFLVSVVAISQGLGYLQLTYIPPSFVIFIFILSFVVGVVTGIYPAKRAKQISALNALRYE